MRFTEEELAIAKSVDLVSVAEAMGYTVKRIGKYHTLVEMDSVRIHNRRTWFRWSRQYEPAGRGGTQIDFLQTFGGMEFREAVNWLLNYAGYRKEEESGKERTFKNVAKKKAEKKPPFVLPKKAPNNKCLYGYLIKQRGLRKEVVDYFVQKGLIYESVPYHNIVFKGMDKTGVVRFASMRGVFDEYGNVFKCDVEGNDKNYGFNVPSADSKVLDVFESGIDLMSYTDIYGDFESNKIALGMLGDAPVVTFLKEHPHISTLRFHLDNDIPGRRATEQFMQRYYELGYEVEDDPPPRGVKDFNEWLTIFR